MVHFQCPCCQAIASVEDAAQARKAVCARCGQQSLAPELPPTRGARTLARLGSPRRPVSPPPPRPRTLPMPPPQPRPPLVRQEEIPAAPPVAQPPLAIPVAPVAAPAPTPRFPTVPYRPEGGCAVRGAIKLFFILLLGAALIGLLASFLGKYYYVILLYPLGMGIALAFIGFYAVNKAKVRSPFLAGFAGLLAAVAAIGAMHYADFRHAQSLLNDPDAPLPAGVRLGLIQDPRFEVYLFTTANSGFRICGENDAGFHMGPEATWAYWGAELLLVAVLTMLATRSEASAPFCSECGQWKAERFLGRLRGRSREVVYACKRGELAGLTEHGVADGKGDLALSAWVCQNCADRAPIDVQVAQSGAAARQDGTPAVMHLTYPGEALPVLEDLFNSRRAA